MTAEEKPKSDQFGRYVLRFEAEEQRARLKARAALNRRTLNAELLYLIEKGMEATDAKPSP